MQQKQYSTFVIRNQCVSVSKECVDNKTGNSHTNASKNVLSQSPKRLIAILYILALTWNALRQIGPTKLFWPITSATDVWVKPGGTVRTVWPPRQVFSFSVEHTLPLPLSGSLLYPGGALCHWTPPFLPTPSYNAGHVLSHLPPSSPPLTHPFSHTANPRWVMPAMHSLSCRDTQTSININIYILYILGVCISPL